MTYQEWLAAVGNLTEENVEDVEFLDVVPRAIEYGELRIYREFDFLNSRTANTAVATASGTRAITIPSTIVVVEAINLISPAGTTNPELGTRIPIDRVSLEYLNFVYPTAATTGVPSVYALQSDTACRLGPTPNGAYTCEIIGTQRPTPLSATVTETFISLNVPDLFLAATMIFFKNYQEEPEGAAVYEAEYQKLKMGVALVDLRRKAESASWQPFSPAPLANVQRERA